MEQKNKSDVLIELIKSIENIIIKVIDQKLAIPAKTE